MLWNTETWKQYKQQPELITKVKEATILCGYAIQMDNKIQINTYRA